MENIKESHNCFWRHKWTEWKQLVSERYGYTYWQTVQERYCLKCGKKQISNKIING